MEDCFPFSSRIVDFHWDQFREVSGVALFLAILSHIIVTEVSVLTDGARILGKNLVFKTLHGDLRSEHIHFNISFCFCCCYIVLFGRHI